MSTAVQSRAVVHMSTDDVPLPYDTPEHIFVLGNNIWICAQPNCDLKHHFWCSCER